jgi:hypothetical protein
MVDRHYSLNLKPWSARTRYVYAHADLAQKYSVDLQEIFVPTCAPRKKILFFCPAVLLLMILKLPETSTYIVPN